jgi:hypothetical protein
MFSKWFSGEDRERYLASPYKHRIDHIGRSLLELRYASEVMRQHLSAPIRQTTIATGGEPIMPLYRRPIPRLRVLSRWAGHDRQQSQRQRTVPALHNPRLRLK